MTDHEYNWDKLLGIKTGGRDDSGSDLYRYPYEPTPYRVLERLAKSGLIGKGDVVLDYGCGKGRVSFFLSHETRAKTVGIEYDADGRKVYNPSAMPWERNNFNAAFEMKSANGNFGIFICREVRIAARHFVSLSIVVIIDTTNGDVFFKSIFNDFYHRVCIFIVAIPSFSVNHNKNGFATFIVK